MDAIILAAGRGKRLRPLTDTFPKPLLEISDMSLIEIHLTHLARAGFIHVIINLHHLGEMIQAKLGNGHRYGLEISYSMEHAEALETAGGIAHALSLIKTQKFAVISADILCDYPLNKLKPKRHTKHMGHLILVDNPPHHPSGDFILQADDTLALLEKSQTDRSYTYSGIAWFDRTLFEGLPYEKMALRPVLEAAIIGGQLSGEYHSGVWNDIGTIERLRQAQTSQLALEYIESIKKSTI